MLPDLELLSSTRILSTFPRRDMGLRTRAEIGLLFSQRDKAVVFISLSLCFIPTAIRHPLPALIPDSLDLLPDRAPGNCQRYRCTFGREHISLWGVQNFFFFQSCFFTLSDMFMTRINHKIVKNHPNNIFFPFSPNLYQILSKKGSKRAPPSASGHFWEFFGFFLCKPSQKHFFFTISTGRQDRKN